MYRLPLMRIALVVAAFFVATNPLAAERPGALAATAASPIDAKPLPDEVDGRPEVIGGEPATRLEYPAVFQATVSKRICTWFLVGPHVLLGAAHCVVGPKGDQPAVSVSIEIPGHRAPFQTKPCSIAEGYPVDASRDWAACQFVAAIPAPVGRNVVGFEVLGTSPVSRNASVEIGGFGCTAVGEPASDVYFFGSARVSAIPPTALLPSSTVDTPNTIELTQEPSILCQGDSGGPAYAYAEPDDRVRRRVVGINSSTLIETRTMYLASVSTEPARAFLQDWADRRGLQICGLDPATPDCRP
jgi:hypothetical protein